MTYNKKVIKFPEPEYWTFWDYEDLNGNDPVEVWHQGLSEEASFSFDNLLKDIQKTKSSHEWGGWRGFLQGKLRQYRVWELGFKADNVEYRVLGFFGKTRKSAVFLIGCYHKGKVYNPADALESAYLRARALETGGARLHERKIRTDI